MFQQPVVGGRQPKQPVVSRTTPTATRRSTGCWKSPKSRGCRSPASPRVVTASCTSRCKRLLHRWLWRCKSRVRASSSNRAGRRVSSPDTGACVTPASPHAIESCRVPTPGAPHPQQSSRAQHRLECHDGARLLGNIWCKSPGVRGGEWLLEEFASLNMVRADDLAESLCRLITLAIYERTRNLPPETGQRSLANRIREYVAQHLHDPGLSLDTIARDLNASKRSLHRAMSDIDDSIHNLIWHARLERCRTTCAIPRNRNNRSPASRNPGGSRIRPTSAVRSAPASACLRGKRAVPRAPWPKVPTAAMVLTTNNRNPCIDRN